MLTRIIYCSTATEGVDIKEFKQILETAQKNNAANDLTGMLMFNSRIFLQVLEGDREQVNRLYNTLEKDPRHANLMILKYERIHSRQWAQWSMSFAPASASNRAVYLKYSVNSQFNPYLMEGDAVEEMMLELTDTTLSMSQEKARPQNQPEKGVLARLFS